MKIEENGLTLSREEIKRIYDELSSLFDIVDPFPETLLELMQKLRIILKVLKKRGRRIEK